MIITNTAHSMCLGIDIWLIFEFWPEHVKRQTIVVMWYHMGASDVCIVRYSTVLYRNVLITYTAQYMCLGIDIELIFEFWQEHGTQQVVSRYGCT